MYWNWIFNIILAFSFGNKEVTSETKQPIVSTKYGKIIGFIDNIQFDNQSLQAQAYLGIPYAEPPIGKLRFEKPIIKSQLPSPFRAFNYSRRCPQDKIKYETMSEDCLYLNIFTPVPSHATDEPKPVMIWIHGGGYIEGYSDIYSGGIVSALGNVIVVTLNYRLGVLGFFSTHDTMASGNYGLWDQQLAIRWVKENIANFGGDVNNITIFGESAGSSSVIYQMIYPGNKGLFHRAIAESGTIAAWAVTHGNANYESSIKFAKSLGCTDPQSISMCLQSKSENEIITAALEMRSFNEVNRSWAPVFDNDFVHSETYNILSELADPNFRSKYTNFWEIDLMIGANNYDGAVYQNLFMIYINNTTPTSISYNISRDQFNDIIVPRAVEGFLGEKPTKLSTELSVFLYTDWEDPSNKTIRLQNILDILTDTLLNAPSVATAKAHINDKASTYVYQFAAKPPKRLIPIAPALEGPDVACHSDEVPFVFGFAKGIRQYWNFSADIITGNDYQLSREMIQMWTNFAKYG